MKKGTAGERINLRNAHYRQDPELIDRTCPCTTCKTFSRAYLQHLVKAQEPLAMTLVSVHNIATMTRLMREIRAAIRDGTLDALEGDWTGGGED